MYRGSTLVRVLLVKRNRESTEKAQNDKQRGLFDLQN